MKNKLKSICNIPFIVCLLILLLNDLYLKYEFHNWLTGKLSDFCGLFVFVSFWAAIFPNQKRIVYFSTALLFVIWKSPISQSPIEVFSYYLYPISRTIDVTDLVALFILPIVFFNSKQQRVTLKLNPILLGLITVFSFCATSIARSSQIFEQPQYLLFKSGIIDIESSEYPSNFTVHKLDSVIIIAVKEIQIDRHAPINDDFHKTQILKELDLRVLKESKGRGKRGGNLSDYKNLRSYLTISGNTSIILDLDSVSDKINFKDTRLHGDFKRISNGNKVLIEGKYKNGIEDSIWTYYNDSSKVASRKYFENGELTKTELFENNNLISEKTYTTRNQVVGDKYFHLAILCLLIMALVSILFSNYKKSEENDIIQLGSSSKISLSIVLPFVILILAKLISSIIPNSYSTFFFEIFGEIIIVYLIVVPLLLLIFFFIKLRNKFDMLYYILLFALLIVLIEEWSFLKKIIY